MISLQCTQKLLKELRPEDTEAFIPTMPLGCWHANLLTIDRRKCVLFTNDLTRYSFFVPYLRKPDFQIIDEVFKQNLFKSLLNEGLSQEHIELVLEEIKEIAITRTSNRSILGTMNDLTNQITWRIQQEGGLGNTDISKLNMDLNRIPIKIDKSYRKLPCQVDSCKVEFSACFNRNSDGVRSPKES